MSQKTDSVGNPARTIVVVEDDTEISRLMILLLESEGFRCLPVIRGDEAVAIVKEQMPDIVLLDVMLPGKNGVDVCGEVREFYSGPILMLTGCDDDITELSSFRTGADDYVLKPIKPHLLLARIEALLRRSQSNPHQETSQLKAGQVAVDVKKREVHAADRPLALTDAEFDLLTLLVKQAGQVVSREECCQELRGFDYDGMDRSIDMRVSALRKKITPLLGDKQHILTVRNRGYMLTV